MSECTIIIPNWNGLKWLKSCLPALQCQTHPAAEIIIVDNRSEDNSCAWLRKHYPQIRIIEMQYNTGFAVAVNAGIRASKTPYIALLNNDTLPAENWLETLRGSLDQQVAAVCGKMLMLEAPDKIENAGDTLSWQGSAEKRGHGQPTSAYTHSERVFAVCAGGALYRRSFFDQVGLFDESFFAYLEDIDLCLRGNLYGYRFMYEPKAILQHQGHGSSLPSARYVRLTTANRLRLFVKNIPASLLWRHSLSILYGQWYFFVCNRRPFASLAGYLDFLRSLPLILRERRHILKNTKLDNHQIHTLLQPRMAQKPLYRILFEKGRKGANA